MGDRQILFFEPETGGHQFDYVRHLVTAWSSHEAGSRITFVVNHELASRVEQAAWWRERERPAGVSLVELTEREKASCLVGALWGRSLAKWYVMKRYLKKYGGGEGVFLHLDHLQLAFAARLRVPVGVRLSGILFRPSVHYEALGVETGRIRERVRDWRKRWMYEQMLRHPAFHRMFTFDPYFAEFARKALPRGDKVRAIPDPATLMSFPRHPVPGPRIADVAPEGRTCFLLFGALARRKGLFQVLEAIALLPRPIAARVAVIFAGRLDPSIASAFRARLSRLLSTRKDVWIHLEDRFLEEHELVAMIQRCDVVLAPYQRFVGSSGVLVWAAVAGKPVITQDYGLLGILVRTYKLGLGIDTTDAGALADAISRSVGRGFQEAVDQERMAQFARGRDAREFARPLLELGRSGPNG